MNKAKPRLFISYGRADATPLAERLEIELQKRGFDVWRDKTQLRAGREWEQQIIDGLRSTQLVVALLSPHSTRKLGDGGNSGGDDSVCLDELAWARFEQPPNRIVPALAVPGANVPLTIFRLHYVDMVGALHSEPVFRDKLEELVAAIDENLKGRVRYRAWDDWLRPSLEFDRFLFSKRVNFTGRQWLFDEIEAWRRTGREPALLIKGDPGIGKSAIIAEMTHRQFYGSTLATYCCQWDIAQTLAPAMFVRMVASQAAARLPAYAAMIETPSVRKALELAEEDPASALEMGLFTPLNTLPAPEHSPLLILIDALDEALGGSYTIVHLLRTRIDRMPPWLKIIATTRRDAAIMSQLGGLPYQDIDAHGDNNTDDLNGYITHRVLEPNLASALSRAGRTTDSVAKILLEKAGGNFLYVQQALESIDRDLLDPRNLDQLPPGLGGIYDNFFRRAFPGGSGFDQVQPILAAICAAAEPLPRSWFAAMFSLSDRDLIRRLKQIGQFLRTGADADPSIAIWHKSLADWLSYIERAGDAFSVDPTDGHALLANYVWPKHQSGAALPGYFLRHLPRHLRKAGQHDRLIELLLDFSYLQDRANAGLVRDLSEEFRLAADACAPATSPKVKLLPLLSRAFRREASAIEQHPHLLLQIMWHLCYWHDAPEAAQHYEWKTAEDANDSRHPWNEPGEKLFQLMKVWRELAKSRADFAPWLRSTKPQGNPLRSALVAEFHGHTKEVYWVAISRDGRRVVSKGEDSTARIWDAERGHEISNFQTDGAGIAITPDGGRVIDGSVEGLIHVRDSGNGAKLASLPASQGPILDVRLLPDGEHLVTRSGNRVAAVLNIATGREVASFSEQPGIDIGIVGRPGRWLLVKSSQSGTSIEEADTQREIALSRQRRADTRFVQLFATPDGRYIISAGQNRRTIIYDTSSQREIEIFLNGYCATTSDCRRIAIRISTSEICVNQLNTASQVVNPSITIATVRGKHLGYALDMTPDGRWVVCGSTNGIVRLWDMDASGLPLNQGPHVDSFRNVAFTPDGRRMITNWQCSFNVWDTEAGQIIDSFAQGLDVLLAQTISDDGAKITLELTMNERDPDCTAVVTRELEPLPSIPPLAGPAVRTARLLWPSGIVKKCESGAYAAVILDEEVVPCAVES